ncbi:unnamed protein product [Phytophthora fragariaefolia]|uniref:Unnamed protein product n=1 Tax=Phytophthora fragariaefolia TaxID=1490495 RepID=A0A9W6YIV3_9STRA|nr:unnamed protein product [Phytophthora fragariaefolia]
MVIHRSCYNKEDLEEALDRAYEGETFAAVARSSSVPLRTLFKKSKELQTTGEITELRRGPKPALSHEQEADVVAWVAGMQRAGFPVGPARVLERVNKIYERLHGATTRTGTRFQPLSKGWYRRFLGRHPVLVMRTAQKIARVRNMVEMDAVRSLFHAIAKRVVELKLSADRVFNMDETSFMPKGTSCKVLALKGSTNVWSKETRPNFHMTVVAAVSAAGAAIPPLIIVPGKRINKKDKAALSIEGACVTGAPKGFSNGVVFRLWLTMFATQLEKLKVALPIVLVLDNSSTHLDLESIGEAHDLGILLLALPLNATHMYQALDVAVFKPFKGDVKDALQAKLLSTADTTLSKKDAIQIACSAYQSAIIDRPDNAISGFRCTGLFPPSFVKMAQRYSVYSNGGASGNIGTEAWLKRQREHVQQEARVEILTLPAPDSTSKKARVTVDIAGKLVCNEVTV